MSETHATAPAFPPGRYGRRRDRRRRRFLPVLVAAVVIAASVTLSVSLYRQYGDPDYDAQIVGWHDVTDTRITVEFTVRVPPGGSAECALRARAYDGSTVGLRTVTVAASGDATTIRAAEAVDTTARASVGEVLHCQPPG
ncbi:uncharacterized protein DUF4307 [Krasilnikovia cinnamomea]|uniref:Uncharacterized protein DUF4307 n=1 Tax=Krasilnikovia cinnamomea TaxID=349313 RepID=A0A4Q7ZN91_9ACTN|nr:DUF4307 domain-containing protein [Krasilnikovia cinnamomea]RZU52151.1 uncharacterized protein DUF4307 [Krasilnikovia cinnamomea]